ncbi:hypothetical protein TIFTF001_022047 [Ficus carica]|uniref:Uncharacterized protein n=1 Tax=Ficus carica TaxID=3494 RepID=A0AA88AH13_FICCA|nr:hypothetical protein TIFTF001_022047 [Ficus carica]
MKGGVMEEDMGFKGEIGGESERGSLGFGTWVGTEVRIEFRDMDKVEIQDKGWGPETMVGP